VLVKSFELADLLWKRMFSQQQYHTEFENVKPFGFGNEGIWVPTSVNEVVKFAKYKDHAKFLPHMDNLVMKNENEKSVFTMVVYLNDQQSDNTVCGGSFQGGETRFFTRPEKNELLPFISQANGYDDKVVTSIVPKAGTCLLFNHDVLHDGAPVLQGNKYIIRAEVMFKRVSKSASILSRNALVERSMTNYQIASALYNSANELEMQGSLKEATLAYLQALTIQTAHSGSVAQTKSSARNNRNNRNPNHDIELSVPFEILLHVFKYLNMKDLLTGASGVNRRWNYTSGEETLWKHLFILKTMQDCHSSLSNHVMQAIANTTSEISEHENVMQSIYSNQIKEDLVKVSQIDSLTLPSGYLYWYDFVRDYCRGEYLAKQTGYNHKMKTLKQCNHASTEADFQASVIFIFGRTGIQIGFATLGEPLYNVYPMYSNMDHPHRFSAGNYLVGDEIDKYEAQCRLFKQQGMPGNYAYGTNADHCFNDGEYYYNGRSSLLIRALFAKLNIELDAQYERETVDTKQKTKNSEQSAMEAAATSFATNTKVHDNITPILYIMGPLGDSLETCNEWSITCSSFYDYISNGRINQSKQLYKYHLAAYGSGINTGILFHMGSNYTYIVAVLYGNVLEETLQIVPLGGESLTKALISHAVNSDSYYRVPTQLMKIKREGCHVAMNLEKELQAIAATPKKTIQVFDTDVTIDTAIAMQQADMLYFKESALVKHIVKCVDSFPVYYKEYTNAVTSSIVLSGGGTMLNGFAERLQLEVTKEPKLSKAVVIANPKRDLFVWKGAVFANKYLTC